MDSTVTWTANLTFLQGSFLPNNKHNSNLPLAAHFRQNRRGLGVPGSLGDHDGSHQLRHGRGHRQVQRSQADTLRRNLRSVNKLRTTRWKAYKSFYIDYTQTFHANENDPFCTLPLSVFPLFWWKERGKQESLIWMTNSNLNRKIQYMKMASIVDNNGSEAITQAFLNIPKKNSLGNSPAQSSIFNRICIKTIPN